jgi:hypothetical protein
MSARFGERPNRDLEFTLFTKRHGRALETATPRQLFG